MLPVKRNILIVTALGLAAFAIGLGMGRLADRPAEPVAATVFASPRELPPVDLLDPSGATIDSSAFTGGWDILFFGFTHCPDICPTTLYRLAALQDRLDDLPPGRQPTVWLVSVDPLRDTPPVLEKYLSAFGPGVTGATGSAEAIAGFAEGLGVAYQQLPEGDSYTVSHTSALFLVDPQARLAALFTTPLDWQAIEADYRELAR